MNQYMQTCFTQVNIYIHIAFHYEDPQVTNINYSHMMNIYKHKIRHLFSRSAFSIVFDMLISKTEQSEMST